MDRVTAILIRLAERLADFLYPPKCAGCAAPLPGGSGRHWCRTCWDGFNRISSPLCSRCGRPFPAHSPVPDHLCGDCLEGRNLFDTARSAVYYQEERVTRRILELKFGGQLHWAPPLADLLQQLWAQRCDRLRADCIVPVPLHAARLRRRGFNQSALLSKFLGQKSGIPVFYELLSRNRATQPQTRLARSERLQNVRGAFDVLNPSAAAGRVVLLVDDVFTTGTTLNECSRALKEAGTSEVHALTVARSVRKAGAEG